jgi:hypothetical protein
VGVESIALDASTNLIVKEEQRVVSDHRISRSPKETFRVAVSPNDVSRGVGHFRPSSKETAPLARWGRFDAQHQISSNPVAPLKAEGALRRTASDRSRGLRWLVFGRARPNGRVRLQDLHEALQLLSGCQASRDFEHSRQDRDTITCRCYRSIRGCGGGLGRTVFCWRRVSAHVCTFDGHF